MTTLKGIFSPNKATVTRSYSKTRLNPPFATSVTPAKPQWNRNRPSRSVTRSAAAGMPSKSLTRGKSPGSAKALPHAHAPDGAEFHQSRARFVQCRNQSTQTDKLEHSQNENHLPEKIDINGTTHSEIHLNVDDEIDHCEKAIDELEQNLPSTLILTDQPRTTQCSVNKTERATVKKRQVKRFNRVVKEIPKERDPNCPLGHVALEEGERIDMLEKLQESYNHNLQELNRLPICVDTLRVRTRRMEIEKHLTQTEQNIKLFSKPKVYVIVKD